MGGEFEQSADVSSGVALDEATDRPTVVDDSFVAPAIAARGRSPLARGAAVGRYVILDRIGAGGMGQVFAAYDPELDRKVAVKLVSSGGFADELRLLREAQALARLAHPNVVAIHDVGVQGPHVWIAMEFVAGETLGAWARAGRRSWRAVLDVLLAAARGVAAVHAAGLVHRDLKPGNVMVGADGRVRVMDFGLVHGHDHGELAEARRTAPSHTREGLAEATLTRAGDVLGTPAYMAPEQWRGAPAAAAADQYGWSVMAWELLFGERPFAGASQDELREAVLAGRRRAPPRGHRVPGWLVRVVERGLAGDPRQRWPDMVALVSALGRGQSQVRRRVALGLPLALAAAAALTVGLQRWRVARQVAACEAAGREIDGLWDAPTRARLRESFAATGLGYAASSAERVLPRLDAWTAEWRGARTELCVRSELRGAWSEDLRARGLACLADRRVRLAALVAEFTRARATTVQRAIAAAADLQPVDDCLDEDLLRRQPAAPAGGDAVIEDVRALLAQAESLELTGDPQAGLEVASRALEVARPLAWPPLESAAQVTVGTLLRVTGATADGARASAAAYFAASRAGAWDIAASAAIQGIEAAYVERDVDGGRLWAELAEVAIAHAGDPDGQREATRLGSLAGIETQAGAFAAARALSQRVVALREAAYAEEHPEVASALFNLGVAEYELGAFDAARELFQRALAVQERTLGPDHPALANTINGLGGIGFATGDHAAAMSLFARALAIQRQAFGPEHPLVAETLSNLASAMLTTGDLAAARATFEELVALTERTHGPDHPMVAATLDNLGQVVRQQGDREGALAHHLRAREIYERSPTPGNPEVAANLTAIADLRMQAGEHAAARPLLARALALREKSLGPDHPDVALTLTYLVDAELAAGQDSAALALLERAYTIYDAHAGTQQGELWLRDKLARLLVRTDRARALALARDARDGFAANPQTSQRAAEIDRWIAEQERPATAR